VSNVDSNEDVASSNDPRSWVDKMFTDVGQGGLEPLDVVAHDCSNDSTLNGVNVVHNTISLLVDFASNTSTKNMLKGEHVLVLGGNRKTRSGLGRLWVPVNELDKLIGYLQQLKVHLNQDLPGIVERVRAER
jgi:hypothetical protein